MRTLLLGVAVKLLLVPPAMARSAIGWSPQVESYDSSGVHITVNRHGKQARRAMKAGWVLSSTATLQIGLTDGPEAFTFFDIVTAGRLSDGRIVIVDGGSKTLRFFSPDGHHVVTTGGEGGGPGEFFRITWAGLVTDTTVVYDFESARVTFIGPRGEYLRSLNLNIVSEVSAPIVRGMFSTEELVVSSSPIQDTRAPGLDTLRSELYRVDVSDGTAIKLNTLVQQEVWQVVRGTRRTVTSPLYHRWTSLAFSDTGYISGWNGEFEFRGYDRSGELRLIVRRTEPPARVTDATTDSLWAWMLPEWVDRGTRQRVVDRYADFPMPQRLPAFGWTLRERPLLRSAILIAESGHVWVREYGLSRSAPAHWSVFTKDGEYLGLVDMPIRFEPFQIGADWILGKWADADGVEYIQLFALDRLLAR